jgi:hypothetical protein
VSCLGYGTTRCCNASKCYRYNLYTIRYTRSSITAYLGQERNSSSQLRYLLSDAAASTRFPHCSSGGLRTGPSGHGASHEALRDSKVLIPQLRNGGHVHAAERVPDRRRSRRRSRYFRAERKSPVPRTMRKRRRRARFGRNENVELPRV